MPAETLVSTERLTGLSPENRSYAAKTHEQGIENCDRVTGALDS